jgi:hypothetical protein
LVSWRAEGETPTQPAAASCGRSARRHRRGAQGLPVVADPRWRTVPGISRSPGTRQTDDRRPAPAGPLASFRFGSGGRRAAPRRCARCAGCRAGPGSIGALATDLFPGCTVRRSPFRRTRSPGHVGIPLQQICKRFDQKSMRHSGNARRRPGRGVVRMMSPTELNRMMSVLVIGSLTPILHHSTGFQQELQ